MSLSLISSFVSPYLLSRSFFFLVTTLILTRIAEVYADDDIIYQKTLVSCRGIANNLIIFLEKLKLSTLWRSHRKKYRYERQTHNSSEKGNLRARSFLYSRVIFCKGKKKKAEGWTRARIFLCVVRTAKRVLPHNN